jgi:hypothetical protein
MQKDFIIEEIIRLMKSNQQKANSMPLVKPDMKAVAEGLVMSKTVCAQQTEVVMTPWMKNLLEYCGDLKDGERLSTERVGKTKAEDLLARVVKAALLKFNGPERTEYNENASVFDLDNYNVDCWLQNKFGDYIWDIKSGQAKERAEALQQYEKPTELTTEKMISFIKSDPVLQKAIKFVVSVYPEVKADRTIHNISAPFMNKDSNTGYPFFRNDRKNVPGSDETWGRKTIHMAEQITNNMSNPWKIWPYNVYTVWARNQRGKGRALEAQSRLMNLVCNSLQAPAIAKLKELPEYVGLNDDQAQKAAMIKMGEFCEANPEYTCGNWDQSAFDRHIGEGLANLAAAIRQIKCNGQLAKELALLRYCQTQKGYCIDGANGKLSIIFGRTMSGDIDTMDQNTVINFLNDVFANMSNDKDYSNNVLYKTKYHGFYLGDDDLSINKKDKKAKDNYVNTSKKLLLEVNSKKYAHGLFFLQYRVCRVDGNYVMMYPWDRVFRNMLSKENKKGLGPVGWAVAGWQQLSKCAEYEPALIIVLNLILPLDKDGLFLDKPISWIKEQIQKEDKAAAEKDKYAKTTASILNQGNPQQQNQFTEQGNDFDYDYLGNLQAKLRAAIRPGFWESLGFKTPKIK